MIEVYSLLVVLSTVGLFAAGVLPSGWLNSRAEAVRTVVTRIAALHMIAAAGALGLTVVVGPQSSLSGLILVDGTSALMLTLVAFVGWVICRFSVRYMDGDVRQGRYFGWTGFTIGAVSLLVVAGNLAVMLIGWGLASLGIHRLLLHFSERPAAQRAAWMKFTISRVGDVLLILATAVLYQQFGTLNLTELFALAEAATGESVNSRQIASGLLIVGAILKTAQFPFHTWLPDTMEAPTPVSALMHAGIVNAGGYVLIRTSPLLVYTTAAMGWLAVSGAVTACFGALVMLSQTSVKRSLAYSTISQMGFMMVQCGLGAFSAAMLHIIAHSLYKAHAFLGSGGVLQQPANGSVAGAAQHSGRPIAAFVACAATAVGIFAAVAWMLGMNPATKPGGFLLGSILCLGLTRWLSQLMASGQRKLITAALFSTVLLSVVYVGSFLAVDAVLKPVAWPLEFGLATVLVGFVVAFGFGGLLVLELVLASTQRPRWLDEFYVHASNGFYVDAVARRLSAVART